MANIRYFYQCSINDYSEVDFILIFIGWQAGRRHGLRRIAKHPELSWLLPPPAYKGKLSDIDIEHVLSH